MNYPSFSNADWATVDARVLATNKYFTIKITIAGNAIGVVISTPPVAAKPRPIFLKERVIG